MKAKHDAPLTVLRLYVAGETPKSVAAHANLLRLRKQHLDGHCRIELVDLLRRPALAARDDIVAIPTLVRRAPLPVRRIIGDLSDTGRVLSALDLRPGPRRLKPTAKGPRHE